jgi:NADH-quinone oxidoreductase subunit F
MRMNPLEAHRLIPNAPYASYAAYRAALGPSAVDKALSLPPDEVISLVRSAGLRGRGGAGFPTGVKWASLAAHPCPTRYVVCNAAEGEPGTFKDRYILRHNPFATLEGMRIAAHAIGAEEGFIAIKASFTREIERLRAAIAEMEASSVLDGFSIKIIEGPEEYLFGEEKALLNVIEGEGPLPRDPDSPPYEVGLFARPGSPNPALVNNVETYARVPSILRNGADSFRAIGTADTPGPLIFTLSGAIERPGMYELPAGISLRELFYEVGGGPRPGRTLKAALSGVSSGVITPDAFDTPAEFGALLEIGAGLGSAGFVVFDDQTSVPRLAQAVARFLYVESCNQCSACKRSLGIASTTLDELFDPERRGVDAPERALLAARRAPQGNRCYLPVQGSVVIPSLIRRFMPEFERQTAAKAPAEALAGGPLAIAKIVDFDEATRTFTLDERQALKLPNWTYREAPHEEEVLPPRSTDFAILLDPDVTAALERVAKGKDLDRQVNEILREWIEKKGKR